MILCGGVAGWWEGLSGNPIIRRQNLVDLKLPEVT